MPEDAAKSVTVRQAEVADAEEITRVHVAAWQHAYRGMVPDSFLAAMDPTDPARIQRRRDHLAGQWRLEQSGPKQANNTETDYSNTPGPDGGAELVAVDDASAVLGFVNLGHYRGDEDRTDPSDESGQIYAIYVDPAHWYRGVGTALLQAAVTALRQHGFDPIRLWVLTDNSAARRFYERHGFRLDGGRSAFTINQPGELPVELDEVRYALSADLGADPSADLVSG